MKHPALGLFTVQVEGNYVSVLLKNYFDSVRTSDVSGR